MKRYLFDALKKNLSPKITLLSGPRQIGKTTLSKELADSYSYYNYDIDKNIRVFQKQEWDRSTNLVIFDELHKKKKWKLWLKGLYDDGQFEKQHALVTGSARLSHLKKVGDSLAGRFFEYRLYPLDLKELKNHGSKEDNYKKLIERGGFPEPLLKLSLEDSRRWRRTHTDTILRQDLLSLEVIRDIDSLEVLIEMLASRAGSLISYNSLAEDLKISDITVKKWLGLLEDLYVIFRINPYSKNIPRSLSKAGKYYFYDLGRVNTEESFKFENLVALSFKKELDFIEDTQGLKTNLHFIRNKENREIDFLIQIQGQKPKLIEVKLSDDSPSRNFKIFEKYFPLADKIQLVAKLSRRFDTQEGVAVENGLSYLTKLDWQ